MCARLRNFCESCRSWRENLNFEPKGTIWVAACLCFLFFLWFGWGACLPHAPRRSPGVAQCCQVATHIDSKLKSTYTMDRIRIENKADKIRGVLPRILAKHVDGFSPFKGRPIPLKCFSIPHEVNHVDDVNCWQAERDWKGCSFETLKLPTHSFSMFLLSLWRALVSCYPFQMTF